MSIMNQKKYKSNHSKFHEINDFFLLTLQPGFGDLLQISYTINTIDPVAPNNSKHCPQASPTPPAPIV